MSTKIMPITDLRRQARAVIQAVQEDGDIVYITQHGRPAVVLLDYAYYEALIAQATARAQSAWPPHYFADTYGALRDDPLSRPAQGQYDEREGVQ